MLFVITPGCNSAAVLPCSGQSAAHQLWLGTRGGVHSEAVHYSDTNMLLNQPDIPAYAAGLPLAYAPVGAVWDYSNAGFAMASPAIR